MTLAAIPSFSGNQLPSILKGFRVRWERGSFIEYERNPQYWDPACTVIDSISNKQKATCRIMASPAKGLAGSVIAIS